MIALFRYGFKQGLDQPHALEGDVTVVSRRGWGWAFNGGLFK